MNAEFIVGLGSQVMWLIIKLVGPILGLGLAAGLIVSVFQATTQIQEPSLTYIPKIAAVIVALLIFGPWMITSMLDFTQSILGHLMQYVQ
ncbi:flagellar biosynthesis protein FliQ [Alicyclobacillus tolerans]|uniref:Flagellar biosynthetic protein FliQ n=2 Tax=Alicyclobacillus tolerans TaxID=90970 RepID=A0A1M6RNH5_9BACL|nr:MULTISPECIES: flagellar biosynthesis protein FliQ [Alicyclobacillus]MDP9728859.1 flagellar biosynthetic protein FliQ [Alicyclobacillus tengchongensis]QRF23707.1 flagellar biosynthesis protein FliQ [Alicyclobacillus sp. TC]SHK34012.1 flagellar biosynthetic protein FliQ [Alicyclobacillus montanus]